MDGADVLIDLLEDNRRRLRRALSPMERGCLAWSPDGQANSIDLTVWHMGRLFDVYLFQLVRGLPAGEECWMRCGWADRTGYDPRGIGDSGWGTLNGYSTEEIAAVPRLDVRQLLAYTDEVYDAVKAFLEGVTMDELQQPGEGFRNRYTRYQLIQMALTDNIRHLGEIFALQAMWERHAGLPPRSQFGGAAG